MNKKRPHKSMSFMSKHHTKLWKKLDLSVNVAQRINPRDARAYLAIASHGINLSKVF